MSDTVMALGIPMEGANQPEVNPNQLWVNDTFMINGARYPVSDREGCLTYVDDAACEVPRSYAGRYIYNQFQGRRASSRFSRATGR